MGSTRAGFVAVAGRPNVGKSTLVNGLVGQKVAIVSDKPQTTRRAIRGVATASDHQIVLVDLPGVQRPRDALTARMQRRVEQELGLEGEHLAVVRLVVHAGQAQRAVDDGLAQVGRVLRADHDVPELARAGGRAVLVDREREDVGRLVIAAVRGVELGDPPGVDVLDRDVTVVYAGGRERQADEALDLRRRRRVRTTVADHLYLEHV